MTYIHDHHRRWGVLFGAEPWFSMQCALYEGPGHDWEGCDLALEQVLYALAKARGLDTTQICARCRRTIDQVRSLSAQPSGLDCELCEQQDQWEAIADDLILVERRAREERWYATLSPEQRALYDEAAAKQAVHVVYGLIARDVQ